MPLQPSVRGIEVLPLTSGHEALLQKQLRQVLCVSESALVPVQLPPGAMAPSASFVKAIIQMTVVYAALIAPFSQAALIPSEGNLYLIVRINVPRSGSFPKSMLSFEYRYKDLRGSPFVPNKQSTLPKILRSEIPIPIFPSFPEAALLAIKADLLTPEMATWTVGLDPCNHWAGITCETLPDGNSTVQAL